MTSGQYFDPEPAAATRRASVDLVLPDVKLTLRTDRGVFSADAVDRGTKLLLLEAPAPPAAGDVLDLGSGYGPIALVLAHRSPGAVIWAVDVNRRARSLTAVNADAAGLTNVRVGHPDEVPADVRFVAMYSNPPVRIGKVALHDLLLRWLGRLEDDGRAYLVIHKHLGSDSLARWLADEGWAVRRLSSRMGYRLLQVSR